MAIGLRPLQLPTYTTSCHQGYCHLCHAESALEQVHAQMYMHMHMLCHAESVFEQVHVRTLPS